MTHGVEDSLVDFEASGLDLVRSYPIQVAWSKSDGFIESYYIRPIDSWTYWDNQAEIEVHEISRDYLFQVGKNVRWVAERMNAALSGRVACWDGGQWDRFWCDRLFYAAGIVRSFSISEYRQPALPPEIAARIGMVAREQAGRAHDAANDVRYLLIYQELAIRFSETAYVP